jgi:cytochrome c biogenesis protein CcmG/thiol:disulfide interchange protein DsbE
MFFVAALPAANPGVPDKAVLLTGLINRKPAQDFALRDSRGNLVRLSDYRGKVVLLNFWATWCGPCKAEIPWFVEFESKYKSQGFAVLGVSMDEDGWKIVQPFIEMMRVNYPMMLGDDALGSKYGGIDSLPETFLIDRKGRVAAKQTGLTDKTIYREQIMKLLQE